MTCAVFKMPKLRRGVTYSPRLGPTRVYVTVNHVRGRIVEVFVDVDHKEGAVLVGIGHALERAASLAFQGGIPVGVIVRAWRGIAGWEGDVTDCDGVTHAESLPDLVAQVLELAESKDSGLRCLDDSNLPGDCSCPGPLCSCITRRPCVDPSLFRLNRPLASWFMGSPFLGGAGARCAAEAP